jgi:hypothetical protein
LRYNVTRHFQGNASAPAPASAQASPYARPEPPPGDARARGARVPACHRHDYPALRQRPEEPYTVLTDRFDHIETTNGYRTLGDTPALLLSFSGKPNRIEINVETQDAIVQFRKDLLESTPNVTIRAGQTWEPDVNTRHIFASNATAGLNATAQVIGRY